MRWLADRLSGRLARSRPFRFNIAVPREIAAIYDEVIAVEYTPLASVGRRQPKLNYQSRVLASSLPNAVARIA